MNETDIANLIKDNVDISFSEHEIKENIEIPKQNTFGDYSFPTFSLAKKLKKNPIEISNDISKTLNNNLPSYLSKVVSKGTYVNFFVNRQEKSINILNNILSKGDSYGSSLEGDGKNIVLDLSSPNIAKPMSMGHLRSTVIGNALSNISKKLGYNTIKINHLGDWGTQFGLMMEAYKLWGNKEEIEKNPIPELVKLYVRINKEGKENLELMDSGRKWFKRLEDGDKEAVELWKWFRRESLKEFDHVYKRLGIDFDFYTGESFYNDKMDSVVDELVEKNLLEESQGAQVVKFDNHRIEQLPPSLIKRSDGASLYMTRDLAAAIYRKDTYDFYKMFYFVGMEQKEHFEQMKSILHLMGYKWYKDIEHVPFGLITLDGVKMSSRKGNVVELNEVLNMSVDLARKQIENKNPDIKNKNEIANDVGIGAVIFNDMIGEIKNHIDFQLENIVKFEGDTGPYVQYSIVRANSLIKKSKLNPVKSASSEISDPDFFNNDETWQIINLLDQFPNIIQKSFNKREPSIISKYSLNLSRAFNSFYSKNKIIDSKDEEIKLSLVKSVSDVLKESLKLLGINSPEEM